MKSIGIVREVDELGRIVIPKETRSLLDIHQGDPLEFYLDGKGNIMLKKYAPGCVFCGSIDNLIYFHGRQVCRPCQTNILDEAGDLEAK